MWFKKKNVITEVVLLLWRIELRAQVCMGTCADEKEKALWVNVFESQRERRTGLSQFWPAYIE